MTDDLDLEHCSKQDRRVTALRNIMTDFYQKRAEITLNLGDGRQKDRLRRVTLNRIALVLSNEWDG